MTQEDLLDYPIFTVDQLAPIASVFLKDGYTFDQTPFWHGPVITREVGEKDFFKFDLVVFNRRRRDSYACLVQNPYWTPAHEKIWNNKTLDPYLIFNRRKVEILREEQASREKFQAVLMIGLGVIAFSLIFIVLMISALSLS